MADGDEVAQKSSVEFFEGSAAPGIVHGDHGGQAEAAAQGLGVIAAGAMMGVDKLDSVLADDQTEAEEGHDAGQRIPATEVEAVLGGDTFRQRGGGGVLFGRGGDEDELVATASQLAHQLQGVGLGSAGASGAPAVGKQNQNAHPPLPEGSTRHGERNKSRPWFSSYSVFHQYRNRSEGPV